MSGIPNSMPPREARAGFDRLVASETRLRNALGRCLGAMLGMIPEAVSEHGIEQCTDVEHDEAIKDAATALYGEDRSKWPAAARSAAEGEFD